MANTSPIITQKNGFKREQRVLTSAEILTKQVVLSLTPSNDEVTLLPISGTPQKSGSDYIVIGNVISWDGYGLETILEENDTLIFIYPIV